MQAAGTLTDRDGEKRRCPSCSKNPCDEGFDISKASLGTAGLKWSRCADGSYVYMLPEPNLRHNSIESRCTAGLETYELHSLAFQQDLCCHGRLIEVKDGPRLRLSEMWL